MKSISSIRRKIKFFESEYDEKWNNFQVHVKRRNQQFASMFHGEAIAFQKQIDILKWVLKK